TADLSVGKIVGLPANPVQLVDVVLGMRAREHGPRRAVPAHIIAIVDQRSVILSAKDGGVELDVIELIARGIAIEELVALRINNPASVSIVIVLVNRAPLGPETVALDRFGLARGA